MVRLRCSQNHLERKTDMVAVIPCLPLGLFGFAWTSLGPDHGIPWIAPMIFTAIVGIGNVCFEFLPESLVLKPSSTPYINLLSITLWQHTDRTPLLQLAETTLLGTSSVA